LKPGSHPERQTVKRSVRTGKEQALNFWVSLPLGYLDQQLAD
jgi:hypothetical protein